MATGGSPCPGRGIAVLGQNQMIEKYKDMASQLVTWLKDVTNRMKQKEFPANLNEMKSDLADIGKIRNEDLHKWTQRRNEIKKMYEELQDDGAKTKITDLSLDPASIKDLCFKFGFEMGNREEKLKANITRLEHVESLLKTFGEDTEYIDGRLDNIEHQIGDVKQHQDGACSLQGKQESDALERELKDVENRVKTLMRNVQTIQKSGYSNTDHMTKRFLEYQCRAVKIKSMLFSSTSQKPSQLPVNVMLTKQHQNTSNGAHMVETNPVFQHVQDCLHWIDTKQAALDGASYGSAEVLIIQELDQQEQEHKLVWDYRKVVDSCIIERDKLDEEEKEIFNELNTKVQEAYEKLLNTSSQRGTWLQSLLGFVQKAVQVLDWLQKKIKVIYNLPELDKPFGQIYQGVIEEKKDMEKGLISVKDIGCSLVQQTHPAKITIETYISDLESQWSWLLQLLECLKVHILHISAFKMYFQQASVCTEWMTQQTENINSWMRHQNVPMQELEERMIKCQNLQEELVNCEKIVASLAKESCNIIPLLKKSEQPTSQIKVSSLCCYEQGTMSLQKDEECFLLDNGERGRWRVKNARGQVDTVPSVCLIIQPPNTEAVDQAKRLQVQLEHLQSSCKTCQRTLAVFLTIESIKSGDLAQDASKCEKQLRELNVEAASLIELVWKTDLKMQQQLQKKLEECNMKVQEVSKKCFKEDFPYQWEKLEMRFEVEKEKKFFSSTLYTIMDVSPGQMQYIVGNTDERDSLLEQLEKRHFRGVFELGLLRIFLLKDEDIRKLVDDPNYGIHLEKEVIKVLNNHIHADQVIKEEKLSQFGMEDVLQAQELGHLECIKSWRVKIYILKSGKGVSIVGREVDKYIQSICKALEQVNKNEPKSERTEDLASSVSETKLSNTKFDTDRDILSKTSLEHAEEREELKYENVNVCKKELGCTKHVTQMLTDSDYAAALATTISEVAVNYISNEVVFQGPPEAVMKAECHLKQYLKSKGFWYEIELAESTIELYKILKFEEDLQRKIPEVYIKFDEKKVIFIGEEKLLQKSEDELRKFVQSIKRVDKTCDKITLNYLKLEDVQRFIWEHFENRQIKCYWQVIGCIIRLFCKSDKELKAAMIALEECIVISHLSIRSESDLQEFENYPGVKKLINQNQGRLHRELIPEEDCVVYVGTREVIAQIDKLHCTYTDDQKYGPHKDSLQILLSQPLLAYVRKYLIENMKQMFQVNIRNLNDLSGISISGAEDNFQNAVSELQKQIKQLSVDIYPLRSPEITNTIDRQVKEIVARVEEETKTVIEIVSLPRRGKDIMRVTVCNKLDVCLVYGSTPGREVDIQLIPVNNSFFPVCLASVDIMEKGVKMHAEAVNRYFAQYVEKQEIKKPEAFQFAYDDSGSSHHIVYFVMPVDLNDIEEFKEKFKCGLLAVLNGASQKKRTSLSLPLEMHEKVSAKQMVTIIMETIKSSLHEIPQHTSIKEIILCSVEKCNQSLLRKVLDEVTPDEQSVGDYVIDDFFGCEEVKVTLVGCLSAQQKCLTLRLMETAKDFKEVEVIVNSTTKELNLADGYLTNIILNAAGSTIQDECRNSYREGIKIGEIAVTSGGKLKFHKIFHGALCLSDVNDSHLLSLRSLMKNCLKKAQEERCQSIAFPALGIGRLKYPVGVVAKEMFRAVTTYAMRFGVKRVKFVLPEKNTDCLRAFKEIENTRNKLLQDSQDGNPGYEASLNDCNIKIAVVVGKKVTMCDVDIVLGNPTAGTPVETISLKSYKYFLLETEKKITINRDPSKWSETLYLLLENGLDLLEEELRHALFYVKLMKFTSCAVDLSHLKKEDDCKSAMEKVFQVVNACKSDPGDLERVTILISDNILQKQTLFSEDNVTAPYRNKSFIDRFTGFSFKGWFSSKSQMTWKMLPDGRLTYLRITGMGMNAVKISYDAVQKGFRKLAVQTTEESVKNSEMEGAACPIPGEIGSEKDSPEKSHEESRVYLKFKAEVAKGILDLIRHTTGEEGVCVLVKDLKQKADVDASNGKVIISLNDFQDANSIKTCVIKHYREAKKSQDAIKKRLIDGGNADTMELLQFAYSNKGWDKKLTFEEGNLYLMGTLKLKEEVDAAVKTVNQWCQDELFLTSDEQKKAAETLSLVKREFPAVFIKQTGDTITIKGDNADSFEKAKHRAKVTLGKIKLTARSKRRNLQADGESFSSLLEDDRMEASPASLPSDWQTPQNRAFISSKTFYTREGITVKVYNGDIVRLPVDCIVNAANKNLSHGGGVALAIAKAAGREFDQESEEYVRKHGIIPVTQCCVTSAGKLHYRCVIHVVGPQWHDYTHNEKDKCALDLKKTVINCLSEANKLNMTSIAVTSISSGIFGVPKNMCAQMYVNGVVEFSRTYNPQPISVREIHFVDMLPEMCQLIQLAFDAELNSRSNNESMIDTIQSQRKELSLRRQELPPVKTQNEVSATERPHSYAEAAAKYSGSKQNPYVIKPWDHTRILIYNHDITDVNVDAIVCPVFPSVEGGVAKSVKRACGPEYANRDYKHVMDIVRNVGEICVTNTPARKSNLPFHHIIHIYSPRWIETTHKENFGRQLKGSVKKILNEVMARGMASVALPILGIGDTTTPVKLLCEYIMDGIATVCSDPHMVHVSQIHLVTNETSLAHQLNQIACQQFGQKIDISGETLQNTERCVKLSEHAPENLKVTIKNYSEFSVSHNEPFSNHLDSSKRGHENQTDTCPICLDTPVDPKAFNGCGHILCRECMEFTVKNKPVCPVCGKIYGIIMGNQPEGTMRVTTYKSSLPGFSSCGTIDILYSFPGGTQTEGHPNPGQRYYGTSRRAYLPDNTDGRKVLSLLKKAFDRRLVFTVGRSVTTGAENTVTWNDIHHKTHKDGGPQNYGYPDPDYLRRVQEELAAKGVTEDT